MADAPNELLQFVTTGLLQCPQTNLRATGVPPLVIVNRKLENLGCKLEELEGRFEVAVSGFTDKIMTRLDQLGQKLDELPQATADKITDTFVVQGAQPLTLDRVKEVFQVGIGELLAHWRQDLAQLRNPVPPPAPPAREEEVDADARGAVMDDAAEFPLLYYEGAWHKFPQDFRFPKCVDIMC